MYNHNYTIIPLTENHLEMIKETSKIETSTLFVTGLNFISKLLAYENYPIKNKRIAIKNILTLLKNVDIFMMDKIDTLVKLNSSQLKHIFTTKHYKEYMNILREMEVLTVVPYKNGSFYEVGKYAMQYRIHNKYLQDDPCLIITHEDDLVSLETDDKYEKRFEKTIKEIEVNYREAIISEFNYNKQNNLTSNNLRLRLSRLLSLNGERYIRKGIKVDRVYHSVTNISRISRKHLTFKDQVFNDVDIKNCQPLLLCYLLKQKGLVMDEQYQFDCESANLYEQFMDNGITRDEAKIETYKSIYFDFKPTSRVAIKFKELYPLTYSSLELLSKEDIKLASRLQNIEASIFNTITPKKSKGYYTLFDSVYFTDINDCVQLMLDMKAKFNEYGIKAMVTVNGETEFDVEELNLHGTSRNGTEALNPLSAETQHL